MQSCNACCAKANPIPARYIHAIMGFLAILNAYTMRQCLSAAITQLVLPRNYSAEVIASKAVCPPDPDLKEGHTNSGTRDWSQQLQSFVLSSFYIGYIITHVPGGLLADKFGSKWVLGLGILSTAIFTLLTPVVIENLDYIGLIALRIAMGLGEGSTFPALSVLLADWVPPSERGCLGSLVMGGGQVGTIVSNTFSGLLLSEYEWPIVFYVWGSLAVAWFLFFCFLCYNSPQKHPCIREAEKEKLAAEIGEKSNNRKNLPPTPFKAIFTSIPMWALIAAQIGHDWAFYIIVTYLPKFFNDVLQIRIDKNGIMSSIPSLIMWICSILSGIIADCLIKRNMMKTTNVRKMMTGIASFGPAIFLITASYAGCDAFAVVAHFCVCMGLMGTYYGGMKLTPIDMSPNYAGIVMAITNGIGSICGCVAPITVGWMTPNTTIAEWRRVFWVAFSILCITGVIYCIWAKSEPQPWNEPGQKKEDT